MLFERECFALHYSVFWFASYDFVFIFGSLKWNERTKLSIFDNMCFLHLIGGVKSVKRKKDPWTAVGFRASKMRISTSFGGLEGGIQYELLEQNHNSQWRGLGSTAVKNANNDNDKKISTACYFLNLICEMLLNTKCVVNFMKIFIYMKSSFEISIFARMELLT